MDQIKASAKAGAQGDLITLVSAVAGMGGPYRWVPFTSFGSEMSAELSGIPRWSYRTHLHLFKALRSEIDGHSTIRWFSVPCC